MFGSVNTNPDYAASQSETRFFTINNLKDFSNSFGNFGVKETVHTEDFNKEKGNEESNLVNINKNKKTSDLVNENSTQNANDAEVGLLISKTSKDMVVIHLLGQSNGEYDNEEIDYKHNKAPVTSSFDVLAAEVGAIGGKISKNQLMSYLQSLTSSGSTTPADSQAIAFVKNLIAQFDSLSDGTDYITSFSGVNDTQDYKTVTKEQVTSPIDLRV